MASFASEVNQVLRSNLSGSSALLQKLDSYRGLRRKLVPEYSPNND